MSTTLRIPLTRGRFALISWRDLEIVIKYKWCYSGPGYAQANLGNYRRDYMHRVILNLPKGVFVDHVNGDKLDNRRSNLRTASRSENARNRRSNRTSTSRFLGVSWCAPRRKWKAQIAVKSKNTFIGRYDLEEDAAKAYDSRASELFGEFANLNFKETRNG